MKHSLFFLFVLICVVIFSQSSADEKQIRTVIQTMEDSLSTGILVSYSFINF